MMNKELKIKVKGEVRANYVDSETGKRVVSIWITGNRADKIEEKLVSLGAEWSGDTCPFKRDPETARMFCKSGSKYPIDCVILDDNSDIDPADVGAGSAVTLYCKIKEGSFNRRSKYVAAYLLGISVHDLVLAEDKSVFDNDDFTDLDDTDDTEQIPFTDDTK